ncbi:MAG: hypothetical protein Kow0089_09540 [Desulfobulbaceae bacterium]
MKDMVVNTRAKVRSAEKVSTASEVSRAGVYTLGIVSALVGLWGLACFVGGLVASGGPLSFIGNWFRAVAGL